jgi:hypothetical protein
MTHVQKLYSLLALLFVIAATSLQAQTITGSVTGTVTDPTGAVVPNAKVTAVNTQTGVSTSTQSNAQGIYFLRFLQIGRYKLTTEAQGFNKQSTGEFGLEVQQEARIDVKVAAAGDVQTVTVTDAAPILNTENPTTGATITAAQATELPLQARNFSSLTTLVAGAVATSPSNTNNVGRPTYNSGFFINGNREQTNNYTLDGVDINDAIDNYINYSPNVDAIGELHIISGNATAEYGNANGGQVVMVTKSGTNNFHGNAYWFLENTNLNANSWTNKHQGIRDVPNLNRSIFGGTLGGPVIRDRLFFFVDYQGARQRNNSTSAASVATAAMRAGFAPNSGQIVSAITNPAARYLFAHPEIYPLPNTAPLAGTVYTNNYIGSRSNSTTNNQGDIKVDGKLTNSDNLSGRFTIGRENDGDSRVILPTSLGSANVSPYTGFSVNWTHVISQNIVNEARAGFSRGRFINLVSDPSGLIGLNGDSALGIPGTQIAPGISAFNLTGYSLSKIGSEGVQNDSLTNAFTYGDNVSWQHGRHSIKFGITAIRYQSNRNYSGNDGVLGHFDYDGTAKNDAWADFLTNNSSAYGQGSYVSKWGQRQWRDALFFQDDWKATPNLTLNLGLRWEWDQPLYESHDKQSNVNVITGAITQAGTNGASRALYNTYWYGYMPRVGFAYAPSRFNGKFSVRGGYGITNFLEGTGANLRLTLNPPFFSNSSGTKFDDPKNPNPSTASGSYYYTAQSGFPVPTNSSTFSGNIRAWDPNLRPALIQQFNLTTETQIDNNTSLVIAYLGQTGNHLVDPRDPNQQHCVGCVRPVSSLPGLSLVSQVSYTESKSMMNYNSLQVSGRRRASKGLEFLTNYTYSKGLTNNLGYYGGSGTASQSAYWQDAYNGSADYGPAFFDSKHIFTFGGYYDLPFGRGRLVGSNMNRALDEVVGGWKLGVTAIVHSGFPITIASPGNYNVNQRANRANHYRNLKVVTRSVDHWFGTDVSASACGLTDTGGCAYGQESANGFGTAAVGSERAPSYKNVDANLSKAFSFTENTKLDFRATFYNVLNTVSLAPPDNTISSGTFGLINSTISTERQIELALKLSF